MRGGRTLMVGLLALSLLGAEHDADSTSATDDCGDMVEVHTPDGESPAQPSTFDPYDLAGLHAVVVRDEAGRPIGLDTTLTFCAPTAIPDDWGELLALVWRRPSGCRMNVEVSGSPVVDGQRTEAEAWLWCDGGFSRETALDSDIATVDGDTITVRLRTADLGPLAYTLARGQRLLGLHATSDLFAPSPILWGHVVAVDYEIPDRTGNAPELVIR